jgi:hypothetical protein
VLPRGVEATTGEWQYKIRGKWTAFGEHEQRELAAGLGVGAPTVTISRDSGSEYTVDLLAMNQQNHATGRERPIRRLTDLPDPPSAPQMIALRRHQRRQGAATGGVATPTPTATDGTPTAPAEGEAPVITASRGQAAGVTWSTSGSMIAGERVSSCELQFYRKNRAVVWTTVHVTSPHVVRFLHVFSTFSARFSLVFSHVCSTFSLAAQTRPRSP